MKGRKFGVGALLAAFLFALLALGGCGGFPLEGYGIVGRVCDNYIRIQKD